MRNGRATRRRERDRRALTLAGFGTALILLLASANIWLMTPAAGDRAGIGGPFSLVADDGRIVSERSFPGKYLAIYFGYTHCQDVCPSTLNTLSAALARLGAGGRRVQPLFITVDPSRDSAAVLRRFVAGFSPDLIGLTGTESELSKVGQEFRLVSVRHQGDAQRAEYVVDHTSVIYLLAPSGRFVAPIPADASEMVMAHAIARHLSAS